MKYYVVSEEELERLSERVWQAAMQWHGIGIERPYAPHEREGAEAACRARPVEQVDLERLLDLPAPNLRFTRVWKEKR